MEEVVFSSKKSLSAYLFIPLLVVTLFISPGYSSTLQAFPQEEVTSKTVLHNGLQFLIRERPGSGLVCIEVRIKSGSAQEGSYQGSGISHLIEHMLFKGTHKYGARQIETLIKSYGGRINGSTSYDSTFYQVTVLSDFFPQALAILKDMMLNAAFDKEELEKEKQVVRNEMKLRLDDPARRIMLRMWENAYITHPYRYPIIGYESPLTALTRDDLLAYYSRVYTPNNMIITVVGDIEAENAAAQIRERFDNFRKTNYAPVVLPKEPYQLSKRFYEEAIDTNLSYLALGFHTTSLLHEDLFAMDVLAILLGQGDASRLNADVVKKQQIAYTISAYNYTPHDAGLFLINAVAERANTDSVVEAVFDHINRLHNEPVQKSELERAKRLVLADYIFSKQTIQSVASDLAQSEQLTGTFLFSKYYVKGIQNVTAHDVQAAAKRYLRKRNLTEIRLNPKTTAVAVKEKETLRSKEAESTTKKVLPNNLTVLLREDHSSPTVSITAVFLGGLRTETAARNGISNFTAQMLLKGTDQRSEAMISGAVEERGGSIAAFSGLSSFGITLTLLSEDAGFGISLIKEIVVGANFPAGQIEKERRQILALIKQQENDQFAKALRLFRETLFGSHPYSFRITGDAASVSALHRDDLIRYFNAWCAANNMVLSVDGDFSTDKILRRIEKNFAGMRQSALPAVTPQSVPFERRIKRSEASMEKEESLFVLGYRTVGIKSRDRYTLEVLASVLSGADGRLYGALREKKALAYSLGCLARSGLDEGFFLFYVSCGKDDLPAVKRELMSLLRTLKKSGVDEKELSLAKKRLIGDFRSDLQTNKFVSFQSALYERYGLGHEAVFHFADRIGNVTKEDIDKVVASYFDLNAYVEVTVTGTS